MSLPETTPQPVESQAPRPNGPVRWLWLILGFVFVALGFVGALLPVMPTTVFLILAAGCFARSSPKLEAWLLDHPRFGPTLRAWRREGAIPRPAKIMACLGMALGLAGFWWGAHPKLVWLLLVTAFMAACAAFVVSRPEPKPHS